MKGLIEVNPIQERKQWPMVLFPLLFSALVVSININQLAAEGLTYQRSLIDVGQVWRLFTGPWVHSSPSHLFWDVSTFLVLSSWCFSWSPKRSSIAFIAGILSLPFIVYWFYPQINYFFGISGLSSLYFTMFCAILIQNGANHQAVRYSGMLGLGLFFMKMIYEVSVEAPLFLDSSIGRPLVLVHITGAVIGLVFGIKKREVPIK